MPVLFTTRSRALVLAASALAMLVAPALAATLKSGFTETIVASGLSNPTAMAFAPDGRLFVCLQGGQLRVIDNNQLLPTPFVTVTVNSSGERGLLGVAFDPNFVSNQFVYVYYTATTTTIHNRVSRFTANGNVAVAVS
jgi:glucose/arabinose dehydrogenase